MEPSHTFAFGSMEMHYLFKSNSHFFQNEDKTNPSNSYSVRISEKGHGNLPDSSRLFFPFGNFENFSVTHSFYQKKVHLLPLKLNTGMYI